MAAKLKWMMVFVLAGLLFTTAITKAATLNKEVSVKETGLITSTGKEQAITIKNKCEKAVGVYIGPKEGLRQPKMKTLGGLSTNTIYARPNDVVCIINDAGKAAACYSVKPGTAYIEINSSGTGLTGK